MKRSSVQKIALVGVMAALVFVTSAFLQIPIPIGTDNTRLHLGNAMCLLSGMLLGPWLGGLASGLGSVLFDLINPQYLASAPFTFLFKFVMGFLCGLLVYKKQNNVILWHTVGGTVGSLCYVALYLGKSFAENTLIHGMDREAVLTVLATKAAASLTNAVGAVVVSTLLGVALRKAIGNRFLNGSTS